MPRFERLSLNLGVYTLIGLVLLTATVLVPLSGVFEVPPPASDQGSTSVGRVLRILEERSETTPRGIQHYQRLEVEVDGTVRVIEHTRTENEARQLDLSVGDSVLVTASATPDGTLFFVTDFARSGALWVIAAAFAVLVIAVGRWQGATSLLGMAASLLVITQFIIPGIISGHSPVTISLIGSAIILSTSLFLAHGVNYKTTTALAGTVISLGLTMTLATFAIDFTRLSGLADEHSQTLQILTEGGINAEGLLLSAIIIGALGVLDDVTVAQASSVFELHAANRDLSPADLFRRAMNIGRDHIASTVNTLFLAYAGAALPLLLILSLQTEPLSVLVNREFMATEVVRTLIGSIGIVASVPVTTALAAFAVRHAPVVAAGDIERSLHRH